MRRDAGGRGGTRRDNVDVKHVKRRRILRYFEEGHGETRKDTQGRGGTRRIRDLKGLTFIYYSKIYILFLYYIKVMFPHFFIKFFPPLI